MSKVGIRVKKDNTDIVNYSVVISQNYLYEYVVTLFDDEVQVVDTFTDIYQNLAFDSAITYLRNDIGVIIDVFEIPTDPFFIEMIQKFKATI